MFGKFTINHLRRGSFLEAEEKSMGLFLWKLGSENFQKNLGHILPFSKSNVSAKPT